MGCQAVDGETFGSSGSRVSSALIGRPGSVSSDKTGSHYGLRVRSSDPARTPGRVSEQ